MNKIALVTWIIKALLGSNNGMISQCSGTLARAALIGFGVHSATVGDSEAELLSGKIVAGVGIVLGMAHKVWEKHGAAIRLRLDAWLNRRSLPPPAAVAGVALLLLCGGCVVRGPLTLNIFSSRMAMAIPGGTNCTATASATSSGGAVIPTSVLTGLDTNAWKAISSGASGAAKLP